MRRTLQLHHILDEQQRLKRWPSRNKLRLEALAYLSSKFREDHRYSEAAVNALIRHWCTFDDPALLRRELFDRGFIRRLRDGSEYWKAERA